MLAARALAVRDRDKQREGDGSLAPSGGMSIRVLEVVPRFKVGGIETWLMEFVKRRQPEFIVDLVNCSSGSPYKEELRAAGVNFFVCGSLSRPFQMIRRFRRLLREQPAYDVVHSHFRRFNGVISMAAAFEGVPVRISHSHSNTANEELRGSLSHRAKVLVDLSLHRRYVTQHLASSTETGQALFGGKFPFKVLHLGIDLDRLNPAISRELMRRELGIDGGALVVGHVGRFTKAKNHVFFERIARVLHSRREDIHFVLVGDEASAELFRQHNYGRRVHVVGVKSNVADYLQTMDVFLFPSLSEGLPLALLEAQAMGLSCVYSDAISEEVEACRELMNRVPLGASPEVWADAVELASKKPTLDRETIRASFRGSAFDIVPSVRALENIYRTLSRKGMGAGSLS